MSPVFSATDVITADWHSTSSSRSMWRTIWSIIPVRPDHKAAHGGHPHTLFMDGRKGVLAMNPAREVKTEKFNLSEGKTPAFTTEEIMQLFRSMDTASLLGQRDRTFLAVMAYTFARVSAVTSLMVKDYRLRGSQATSVVTVFGLPKSLTICRTATVWRWPSTSPVTPTATQPSTMIA